VELNDFKTKQQCEFHLKKKEKTIQKAYPKDRSFSFKCVYEEDDDEHPKKLMAAYRR
jgi:hypothetical protein